MCWQRKLGLMLRANFPRKTSLTVPLPSGSALFSALLSLSSLCSLWRISPTHSGQTQPGFSCQRSEGTITWSLKSGRHQYTALLSRRSDWELSWQYFSSFPGVVYQLLCCHVKPWHGSDDSRCEEGEMSITGAPGWAELSSVSPSPRCQLAVTSPSRPQQRKPWEMNFTRCGSLHFPV